MEGNGECWHKNDTFLEHLVDIYRILKIWKAPDPVCFCGLFHTAYSVSHVRLAIFDPSIGRGVVRGHVGESAERLIHLLCIVDRKSIIDDGLMLKYSDSELVEHLTLSEISLKNGEDKGFFDEDEVWRKKLRALLPENGIVTKNVETGEDVLVSRRIVATFLMMTMADFSDQLFSFQDVLFENSNGRLEFSGNNFVGLWPGSGKPGLWLNSISRMGAIYSLIVREEELLVESRKRSGGVDVDIQRDENIELVLPPVFEKCTKILDANDQIQARDLYWEAVCDESQGAEDRAVQLLLGSIEKNPFVGEPHVVLAQAYLIKRRFEEAEKEAEKGLTLMLEWSSPWDKRISWEGWVAWARVLLMKAKQKSWVQTSWDIINLGLVK